MKIGKLDKPIANLHDKTESAILQKKFKTGIKS